MEMSEFYKEKLFPRIDEILRIKINNNKMLYFS